MPDIYLQVSTFLLEDVLHLGDRRIVNVSMVNEHVVLFLIDAPDAPDGTKEMEPTFHVVDGIVTMTDPGWRS